MGIILLYSNSWLVLLFQNSIYNNMDSIAILGCHIIKWSWWWLRYISLQNTRHWAWISWMSRIKYWLNNYSPASSSIWRSSRRLWSFWPTFQCFKTDTTSKTEQFQSSKNVDQNVTLYCYEVRRITRFWNFHSTFS